MTPKEFRKDGYDRDWAMPMVHFREAAAAAMTLGLEWEANFDGRRIYLKVFEPGEVAADTGPATGKGHRP